MNRRVLFKTIFQRKILAFVFFGLSFPAWAETVVFMDGTEVKGRIVQQGGNFVKIEVAKDIVNTYYDEIDSIIEDVLEDEEEIKNGPFQGFDEHGNLAEEGFYKNGKREGLYKQYHSNGQLKYEGSFVNGKENGMVKSYYENGQLERESAYKNGVYEGYSSEYYDNGQIRRKEFFRAGKREGAVKEYYEDGKLFQDVNYKDDEVIKKVMYDREGNVVSGDLEQSSYILTPMPPGTF